MLLRQPYAKALLLCDCPGLDKMGGERAGATRNKEQSVLPHGRVMWSSFGSHPPAAARLEDFAAKRREVGFAVGA